MRSDKAAWVEYYATVGPMKAFEQNKSITGSAPRNGKL